MISLIHTSGVSAVQRRCRWRLFIVQTKMAYLSIDERPFMPHRSLGHLPNVVRKVVPVAVFGSELLVSRVGKLGNRHDLDSFRNNHHLPVRAIYIYIFFIIKKKLKK